MEELQRKAIALLQDLLKKSLIDIEDWDTELEVVLDIDNYRKNQEANAELVAKEAAKKVRAQSIAVELPPMPSYRRRAVHTMFMNPEYADLEVYSIGDGL